MKNVPVQTIFFQKHLPANFFYFLIYSAIFSGAKIFRFKLFFEKINSACYSV